MQPTESDFVVLHQGIPRLRDSGIAVREVFQLWRSGVNMADIPGRLPALSVAEVFAALRYARDHEDQLS
ncbi:MAG TPA: DUF433 domain-containing protein [Candidatus Xenobia bacterium]